jgi:predicted small metal-binding protein
MKKLSCKDHDPNTNCSFVANGENSMEVAEKMMEHMKLAHQGWLADMMKGKNEDDVKQMLAMKVRDE